jgi:hypothetical protein
VKLAAELTSKNGVGVICPAERSLFGYYEKLGYKEYFYVQKSGSLDPGIAVYGSVRRVGTAKYIDLRRALLSGRSYIDFSEKTLSYQKHLCDSTGGGLYSVITDGVQCCAACEIYDGKLYIKELLAPDGSAYNSALLLCRATGCRSFSYRTTAHPMAECSPFGMVLSDKLALRNDTGLAWLGFAFD